MAKVNFGSHSSVRFRGGIETVLGTLPINVCGVWRVTRRST